MATPGSASRTRALHNWKRRGSTTACRSTSSPKHGGSVRARVETGSIKLRARPLHRAGGTASPLAMLQSPEVAQAPLAVVLLSGGLDSMVCAGLAKEQGFRVLALTIDYNQRHRIELDAARVIAERVGVERHVILPLDLRQFGGSALTADIDVPKDGVGDDIPVTYVPARNLVFLSLALAWAEAAGSKDLF